MRGFGRRGLGHNSNGGRTRVEAVIATNKASDASILMSTELSMLNEF